MSDQDSEEHDSRKYVSFNQDFVIRRLYATMCKYLNDPSIDIGFS